jgi:hypothetical protein
MGLSVVLALVLIAVWRRQLALKREAYIRSFDLPHGLFERLTKQHPGLTLKQCQLVAHGLRQFFLAHLKAASASSRWRRRSPTIYGTSSSCSRATTRRSAAARSAAFCITRRRFR